MDPELTALTSTAATTVVQLLATEGWERAQAAVTGLWRRLHPERADTVSAELEESRSQVLAARRTGDGEAERDVVGAWQGRLRSLLLSHPEVAVELRRLLADELEPALAATTQTTSTTMSARASGHARVYQAGRDQHITEA
ncbi:hypothetical protein [Streptomyces sp. NPDC059398]|uniref:hypothetical protein n=1 Tax=Streptomyces sp. NPDC059398 TaxID=3346820 RepID=UPI0036C53B3B